MPMTQSNAKEKVFSVSKHPKTDRFDDALVTQIAARVQHPIFDFVSNIGTSAGVRQPPKCTRGT